MIGDVGIGMTVIGINSRSPTMALVSSAYAQQAEEVFSGSGETGSPRPSCPLPSSSPDPSGCNR